ncbi:hypothetical protein SNE40_022355 [Patella caerulea]|uniref:Uncharacterized protein n=1 Tax=Patella caerulea TaxID=87958 RepID=A0AAN8FW89_PATCE
MPVFLYFTGGLSSTAKSKLNKEYFVYARDGSLLSRNAGTMKSLATGDELVELDGSNSQCRHYNCLHDVMIIRHPWDPMKFDLSRDYGLFSVGDREVQYDYITKTQSRLSGLSRG